MKKSIKLLLLTAAMLVCLPGFAIYQTKEQIESWNSPVEPFRIAGNIYYVGASDVTSYLITTPKGHILIDSGLPETVPQIARNIAKLGFKLTDVKIILNSHAHFDHAGGIAELRRLTHAKFFACKRDAPLLRRGGLDDPNYADRFPFEAVPPDEVFSDGHVVKLGGASLTAHNTAGHTPGCTTWMTKATEGKRSLDVAFICSVSSPNYQLVDNKKYPEIEQDYLASFAWLEKTHVDVFLAAHGGIFGLTEKMEILSKSVVENPFIDPDGYKKYVASSKTAFLEKLRTQKSAAKSK